MSYICVKKLVLILVKWRLSEKKSDKIRFSCASRVRACYMYMKTAHEAHRHSTAYLPLPPEGRAALRHGLPPRRYPGGTTHLRLRPAWPPQRRTITRQGSTRTDAYTYNNRSEQIGDVVDGTSLNGWDYDLAAAASSSGVASNKKACANQLNQYTAIEDETHDVFTHTSLRFI